jgi:hypothetical protein
VPGTTRADSPTFAYYLRGPKIGGLLPLEGQIRANPKYVWYDRTTRAGTWAERVSTRAVRASSVSGNTMRKHRRR